MKIALSSPGSNCGKNSIWWSLIAQALCHLQHSLLGQVIAPKITPPMSVVVYMSVDMARVNLCQADLKVALLLMRTPFLDDVCNF